MDPFERLRELSSQMQYEPGEENDCPVQLGSTRHLDDLNITQAVMPNGRTISLMKTLLTSACEKDCNYCPFRAGRDFRRATLSPDEMAKAFMAYHRAGVVEGLFLSSGVAGGGLRTQDKIIATAEILRKKYRFGGYIHLKIMPGAEFNQIEQSMKLANRVSINLEAPNPDRLVDLAPHKSFLDDLIEPMKSVEKVRARLDPVRPGGMRPSMTTQFVVGAVGESDLELLSTTEHLIRVYHLKRAYYSAFNPVPDTPLENLPPASHIREHRLYQASFLLRDYGFSLEDLPFESGGDLPMQVDPKLAWARQNLAEKPVEINLADLPTLLRLPGIGPKNAQAILSARRFGMVRSVSDLKKLGIAVERLLPFVLLNGRKPVQQLSLWSVSQL